MVINFKSFASTGVKTDGIVAIGLERDASQTDITDIAFGIEKPSDAGIQIVKKRILSITIPTTQRTSIRHANIRPPTN